MTSKKWFELENDLTVWPSLFLIQSELTLLLPLERRLAKCAPPIPSCMLFSPTMPWGSVHLSVNMVSLKYDLIRFYRFPAETQKHTFCVSLVSSVGFSYKILLQILYIHILCIHKQKHYETDWKLSRLDWTVLERWQIFNLFVFSMSWRVQIVLMFMHV